VELCVLVVGQRVPGGQLAAAKRVVAGLASTSLLHGRTSFRLALSLLNLRDGSHLRNLYVSLTVG